MTISYTVDEEWMERINREFVDTYDHKYWLFKLKTNRILVDNLDAFIDEFGDDVLRDESVEAYRLALQSEVVYDFFHTTEALFALFIANRVSYIPWRKIRHLGVGQTCQFIRDIVLADGLEHEDIRYAFYRGTGEKALEENEELRDSVDFIESYLRNVGHRFLDHELYNHYKHGLRVVTSRKSVTITADGEDNPVLKEDGSVHIYLDSERLEKDGSDEIHRLVKIAEWFDYETYYNLCMVNYHLIRQMFRSLRQNYREGDNEGMINITLFDHDLEELFGGGGYRLTEQQKYPVGEKLYELG